MRGETFVTRKITRALARIKLGLQDRLYLGNFTAQRDWGHARDYIETMWLMLRKRQPDDFVIATGEQHSVREFVATAATELEFDEHIVIEKTLAVYSKLLPGFWKSTDVLRF